MGNEMKPGQAKRGAKPRPPELKRIKRTVYHTEQEQAEYLRWLAEFREKSEK